MHLSTSTAAFHNGSMMILDSKSGSSEYQTAMSEALERAIAEPRPKPRRSCSEPRSYVPSSAGPFDELQSFLSALFKAILSFLTSRNVIPAPEGPPSDPISAMFQREIATLEPFVSHRHDLSPFRVRIAIPAYLQGTELGCSMRYTSKALLNSAVRFCNPADAAFSALAYKLCRIPSDWWSCPTPPRMMVVEHDEKHHMAFASWINLRVSLNKAWWDVSRINPSNATDELRQWVENLIDEHDQDLITLVGNETMVSNLIKTTNSSKIVSRLVRKGRSILPQSAIALGAAQGAKELMDRQDSDCVQDQECYDIQQKADELVGKWEAENVAVIYHYGATLEHQELCTLRP